MRLNGKSLFARFSLVLGAIVVLPMSNAVGSQVHSLRVSQHATTAHDTSLPYTYADGVTVPCGPVPKNTSNFNCLSSTGYHGQPVWGANKPDTGGHNCTSYVAFRLQQNGAAQFTVYTAANWGTTMAQSNNWTVNQSPAVGSIAWWSSSGGRGTFGHVAYVEGVGSNYVDISEDVFTNEPNPYPGITTGFDQTERLSKTATPGTYGWPTDFIHIKDMVAPPGQPGKPNATTPSPTEIVVSWPGVSGATSYQLQWTHKQNPGSTDWTYWGATSSTSVAIPVTTGQSFMYQVRAVNSGGNSSWSQWSNWVFTTVQVKVSQYATGGVSGHTCDSNSCKTGPTRYGAIWIRCYETGPSINGPTQTGKKSTAWDLASDGYYYTDAWLQTGSNNPVVPSCDSGDAT